MARYDENNTPYSWMPGFLRRFLNLTYDEPQAGGSGLSQSGFAPAPQASAARAAWATPSEPTFKPTSMESYTPPASSYTAQATSTYAPPLPPAPDRSADGSSAVSAGPATPSFQISGGIQPVTYLLRAYARGILPPQGLEEFTKQLRKTSTDVWGLYSHWFFFQTEDVLRFSREVLTTITDALPTGSSSVATSRRIKVTVANGDGNGHNGSAAAAGSPADGTKS
jgi:hypothetical protein